MAQQDIEIVKAYVAAHPGMIDVPKDIAEITAPIHLILSEDIILSIGCTLKGKFHPKQVIFHKIVI